MGKSSFASAGFGASTIGSVAISGAGSLTVAVHLAPLVFSAEPRAFVSTIDSGVSGGGWGNEIGRPPHSYGAGSPQPTNELAAHSPSTSPNRSCIMIPLILALAEN